MTWFPGYRSPAGAARAVSAEEARRHSGLVDVAVADGRLMASERPVWLAELAKDEAAAARVLVSLAPASLAARRTDAPSGWFPQFDRRPAVKS